MSERNFCVLGITPSLKDKCIYVEFNLDIDEDTVSSDSFMLMNKTSMRGQFITPVVDNKIIKIEMSEWPQPGDVYSIIIQNSIKSVVGDSIETVLMRSIKFTSEVISDIKIISPANFEKISEVFIKWNEIGDNLENRYYIEIAKENAFYNCVYKTFVEDKQEISFNDIEEGQYFVRIRADKNDNYGRWSDTTTFVFQKKEEKDDSAPEEDPPEEIEDDVIIGDESSSDDNKDENSPPTSDEEISDSSADNEEGSTDLPDENDTNNNENSSEENDNVNENESSNPNEDASSEDNSTEDNGTEEIDKIPDEDIDIPIIDDTESTIIDNDIPLEIIMSPKSGITPADEFIFTFNEDIDISEAVISIYREDFCEWKD